MRCIKNPLRGNQNAEGSKKCAMHNSNDASHEIVDRIDFRPMTRNFAKQVAIEVVSGEGCKEKKLVNKYEERTAGMLYFFRSCGIRLSHYEMYTSESLSTVFTCLRDMFEGNLVDISGVVYDRACDLLPYVLKLMEEGNDFAEALSKLRFIVDIFHAEKHTLPKCVLEDPGCCFHPDLQKFADVRPMNMEVAEQSFHVLNCYKHSTRSMTYGKRLCLLKFIDNEFNILQERKILSKNI